MVKNKKFFKYVKEYHWSNVFAMIKNNRLDPKICNEAFSERLVVITGATSGIGYLTARKYASQGANLLCINRNPEKSKALKQEIQDEFNVTCEYLIADLSKLKDINKVADSLCNLDASIDVLIHNAGVYLTKKETTDEGLEKTLVVHYLSSFIINFRVIEKLKAQKKARIILVNSEGHRFAAWGLRLDDMNWKKRSYSGLKSYGSAKLAQLLSMLVFADYFQGSGVTINAMHPGAVKTETGQENGRIYRWFKRNVFDKTLKSPGVSAEALYYLGVSDEMEGISARFFNLTTEEEPTPPALDKEEASELWTTSLRLCGLSSDKNETMHSETDTTEQNI